MTWPYPGDSPNARIRRVALAYRQQLSLVDAEACAALDRRMIAFGQTWVVPQIVTVDPDEWMTPAQAADYACVEVDAIRQARRRGRLKGRKVGSEWEYQAREIEEVFMRPRGRNATVTDTITNSTSVPRDAA